MRKPIETKAVDLIIRHDAVNEQFIIAASMANVEIRKKLINGIAHDIFQIQQHQQIWKAITELTKKNLEFDFATLHLIDGEIDIEYLQKLNENCPDVPPNLDFHIRNLKWDKVRADTIQGPLAELIAGLKNPKETQEHIKTLAKSIVSCIEVQDKQIIRDNNVLISDQITDLKIRKNGVAVYSYGIESLDKDENGIQRMLPGAKPQMVTVVTGLSGAGKTTTVAQMVLGIARQYSAHYKSTGIKKKILFGAWETGAGPMIELMACLSLGIPRRDTIMGNITDQQIDSIERVQKGICEYVKFIDNPFQRKRSEKRRTNDYNLDLIQSYIEDTGCSIFVADLLQRAFVEKDPEKEESALFRFQAMMQETICHGIVCHQMRLKDVEQRADKKPTRESLKGSSAWIEIADTVLGVHRPGKFLPVLDKTIEISILKQRYGEWPLCVEFDLDPKVGIITNGKTIDYNRSLAIDKLENGDSFDSFISKNDKPQQKKKWNNGKS